MGEGDQSTLAAVCEDVGTAHTVKQEALELGATLVPSLARGTGPRRKSSLLAVGDVVGGRYRLQRCIGRGGFGDVFAAVDQALDVVVALKVLRTGCDQYPSLELVKREIQLARRVTHVNVCRIYDVGFHQSNGKRLAFLTMELLEGRSLAAEIGAHKRLSALRVVAIARQVCSALEAAHSAGVVHGDIKPENIMLVGAGESERVVVTDFGLASLQDAESKSDAGLAFGTPMYMAPEQVECKPLTAAADFYALGCTLFYLVTGTPPFSGSTVEEMARARLTSAVPDARLREPSVPPHLSSLIARLMQRDPGERTHSAASLRRGLNSAVSRRWVALSFFLFAMAVPAVLLASSLLEPGKRAREFRPTLPRDAASVQNLEEGIRKLDEGRPELARQRFQRIVDAQAATPLVHQLLAEAEVTLGRRDEAREQLETAHRMARDLPEDERLYFEASYRTRISENAQAIALLTHLRETYPHDERILRLLAENLRRLEEHDAAVAALDAIQPTSSERELDILALRARILFTGRRMTDALEVAKQAVAIARSSGLPLRAAEMLSVQSLALRDLTRLEEAQSIARQALELANTHASERHRLQALYSLSAAAVSGNDFDAALRAYDEIAEIHGASGNELEIRKVSISRAEIALATSDARKALSIIDDEVLPYLREDPHSYWEGYARLVRSDIHREMGQYDTAIDDCRSGESIYRGIENERLRAFALIMCGLAHSERGETDMARRELQEALGIRETLGIPHLVWQTRLALAEVDLAEGRGAEALSVAVAALEYFQATDLRKDSAYAAAIAADSAALSQRWESAEEYIDLAGKLVAKQNGLQRLKLLPTRIRIAMARGRHAEGRELAEAGIERAAAGGCEAVKQELAAAGRLR